MSVESIGGKIYDGTAELGQVTSKIKLGVGICISLCLLGCGIYSYTHNTDSQYTTTKATITTATCNTSNTNGTSRTQCTLQLKYKDNNGVEYNNTLNSTDNKFYTPGQTIDISYESTNPNNIQMNQLSLKTLSYILSCIAVLIVVGVSINYYLAQKSKVYASFSGASDGIGMISSAFRR